MKIISYKYRLVGLILLFASVPLSILVFYLLRKNFDNYEYVMGIWGSIIFNYPIAIALILIAFSKSKHEDEHVKVNRQKAFVTGAEIFVYFALIFSVIYAFLKMWLLENREGIYFGGLLGSLNIFLVIVNIYILYFQRHKKK